MNQEINPKLTTFIGFFITLLVLISSCGKGQEENSTEQVSQQIQDTLKSTTFTEASLTDTVRKDTLRIIGVGDLVPGSNHPNTSQLPPNLGKDLMKSVHPILQSADLTFGTYEACILDAGGQQKYCQNPAVCYAFRLPEKYAEIFPEAGFDIVSLANNHINDFGNEGVQNTRKVFNRMGIKTAGLKDEPYTTYEKDGIKYGIASFAPYYIIVANMLELNYVRQIVRKLKEEEKCDIVLVSGSGGAEGASHQHVTRATEMFYGENRGNVYEFAHAAIDAGADLVLQNGPHVLRGVELYKDKFIAYSLGNFCSPIINVSGLGGIGVMMEVKLSPKGEFLEAVIHPTTQQSKVVLPDPEKRAIKIIRDLTKADFPETNLEILDDGRIIKKNK